MSDPLAAIDVDLLDELPLWSAPFASMMLDRIPLDRSLTYLDVGCGTGWLTVEIAQRCGRGVRVIAVDPWHEAVARLGRKVRFLGFEGVTVIESDAAEAALDDGTIDVIVSNLGVNNFADPPAVLARLRRAARPGGRLFLTTNLTGHMAELYEVLRGVLLRRGHADRLEAFSEHVAHRGTVESVSALLAAAGFDTVDVATGSFRMRWADGAALLRHFLIRVGFLPAWKALVPGDDVEETFADLERALDAVAAEAGELALTIPTAMIEARA